MFLADAPRVSVRYFPSDVTRYASDNRGGSVHLRDAVLDDARRDGRGDARLGAARLGRLRRVHRCIAARDIEDQATAKLKVICTVQLASSLLPVVLLVWIPELRHLIPFFLGYGLLSVDVAMITFAAKVRLFGKLAIQVRARRSQHREETAQMGGHPRPGRGDSGWDTLADDARRTHRRHDGHSWR